MVSTMLFVLTLKNFKNKPIVFPAGKISFSVYYRPTDLFLLTLQQTLETIIVSCKKEHLSWNQKYIL